MNETKEHILSTSLILFMQKSYRDVTMREIVEKTGLSKGAFYHYFASKEELFKEIALMFFTTGVIDYSAFPQDSLNKFYNYYVNYIGDSMEDMYKMVGSSDEKERSSLNFFFIMFEAISRFPEFLNLELEQYKLAIEAWGKVIGNAREQGEIRTASEDIDIANLFLYCTDGVFIRFVNSDISGNYRSQLLKAFDSLYNTIRN